jgi:hypothetical protein
MKRASYKGERGFVRYVGWCVITKNLFSIARWQERKKKAEKETERRVFAGELSGRGSASKRKRASSLRGLRSE